jgi:hypothetical protein
MRRFAIFTAGAALVLGSLAIPGLAFAGGRTTTPEKSTTISAQAVSPDTQFTAQGKGHGKGRYGKGYRRGYRHGYRDSRYDGYGHGYGYGYGRDGYYGDGRCYGCDGPGSRCDRYGCAYRGGYYGGGYGYGCGWDDGCGPYTQQYDCTRYRGPDGRPAQDPHCRYDQRCDCYYHSSEPPPRAGSQPAPDGGGASPGPDQGASPGTDQGQQPPPNEGGGQPRPY